MSEKYVFYQVDDRKEDSFYGSNLQGTNLLTVAEEEAKKQTANQATRYIHRHTLEVIKTFKVEDKPKETRINKKTCKFEKCTKAVVLDGKQSGSSVLFIYCHLHMGLVWHSKLTREFHKTGQYVEHPHYKMPKISKAKALKLLKSVVSFYDDCDGYTKQEDRDTLRAEVQSAGMVPAVYPRYTPKTLEPRHRETLEQMCYTIVEAGGLA